MNGRKSAYLWMGCMVVAMAALQVGASAQQQQQQGLFGSHKSEDGYVTYPDKIFYLRNAIREEDPAETVTALRNMLDPKDRIYLIPGRQAILVEAPADQLALAEKFIHEIDVPRPEVDMHVAVLQVSHAKLEMLAVNKDGALSDAVVRELMQDKETKVLADQRLRTSSRYGITLKSGSKIPFLAEAASQTGDVMKPAKISYIDVGVNMDITPYVHEDGMIDVWVKGEVSTQSGSSTIGGVNEPMIAQTVLDSNPQVHEGETTLLAASRRENEEQGIVFLLTPRIVWTPTP